MPSWSRQGEINTFLETPFVEQFGGGWNGNLSCDKKVVGLKKEANKNALTAGVENLVEFSVGDVGETDLDEASVLISFLVSRQLKTIRDKIEKHLHKGGRVACYHYPITGVTPHDVIELKEGQNKYIYIYKHL